MFRPMQILDNKCIKHSFLYMNIFQAVCDNYIVIVITAFFQAQAVQNNFIQLYAEMYTVTS